ncbi:MAG: hypothetical protein KDN22_31475 [Verrucomicrobiae bacterium]|nr:hypothetical protein [Verrucomicrobiae bacterium]
MIPVVFTKKHFTQIRTHHNPGADMHNTNLLYSADGELFSVQRVETVEMPHERSDLRFEVEVHDANHEQRLFVGLMETEKLAISEDCPGLAVAISLGEGTMIDLINDTGIVGYYDSAPFDRSVPVRVSVEVDVIGRVCIPKITVNGESILHPALQLNRTGHLSALIGCTLTERSVSFKNGKVSVIGRRDRASV